MSDYTTDEQYRAAKGEISNALAALDRMSLTQAITYLKNRLMRLNDQQGARAQVMTGATFNDATQRLVTHIHKAIAPQCMTLFPALGSTQDAYERFLSRLVDAVAEWALAPEQVELGARGMYERRRDPGYLWGYLPYGVEQEYRRDYETAIRALVGEVEACHRGETH